MIKYSYPRGSVAEHLPSSSQGELLFGASHEGLDVATVNTPQ